jgi:hypothetical protein
MCMSAPESKRPRVRGEAGVVRRNYEYGKQRKTLNKAIKQIVKKYGGKNAVKLFSGLSKFGCSNFRRAMRRIRRVIQ